MIWQRTGLRWLIAGGMAYLLVAGLALATQWVVETMTSATYTIHWLETVPIISLAFAWFIQKWLREPRDGGQSKAGDPSR